MAAETSLYRRHRPQTFDQVVGQEHIVRTLRNAVERDRVHHAYLFVGSRGTGKTSMAKILARSLNCVNGPTVTPCGVCDPCREIAAGTSLDVIEMDAASNRSVDDIRELRGRVGYAASGGKWKVYILDEAHMLTREAWNAFLKTLEEPPPNTVFVLATTEAEKVMPTIVDRCQRFDFQRPGPDQIAEVVQRVAAAEGIKIDAGAVGALARSANGSFRDALGTLDQLRAYSGGKIATEDALAVLGVADFDLLFAAADAIAVADSVAAFSIAERLAASGRDPARFGRDLIEHLRRLLVVRTIGEVPDAFAIAPEHGERLAEQAGRVPDGALIRSIELIEGAVSAIREGDDPRMTIDVALIRTATPRLEPTVAALAERIERLERGTPAAPAPPTAPAPAPISSPPMTREGPSTPPVEPEAAAPAVPTAVADPPRVDLDRIAGLWPAVIDQVRQSGSELLSTVFEAARPIDVDAEEAVLRVGFPQSMAFNKRKAEVQQNRDRLAEAVRTIVGEGLRPVYVLLEDETIAGSVEDIEITEDEVIAQIKSSFDAEEIYEAEEEAG